MKKLFCLFFLIVSIVINFNNSEVLYVFAESKPIYLLGNAESNQILEQNDMLKKVPIASITKLMTAYICFQKFQRNELSSNEMVIVSQNASEVEPSKAYLVKGEKYLLGDLLKVMIVKSANDCAIAIAEHISGSEKEFARLMNKTALEIGMKRTNYTNASGLSTPNQYSSAYDQYLLFQQIIRIGELVDILKCPQIQFNNSQQEVIFYSTNKLINNNIIGKTGYTIEAENCFCGCNYDEENKFIYITLGHKTSEERFHNVKEAFDSAKKHYSKRILVSQNEFTKEIKHAEEDLICKHAEEYFIYLKHNQENQYSVIQTFNDISKFPIQQGQKVGETIIIFNNKIIKRINIIAQNKVQRISLYSNIKRIVLA